MVLVMEQRIVASLRSHLIGVIQKSIRDADLHSIAFVSRLLGKDPVSGISIQTNIDTLSGEAAYEGYPHVACLGFLIGASYPLSAHHESDFLSGIARLRKRSDKGIEPFLVDDVAILGIADGLVILEGFNAANEIDEAKRWLTYIINKAVRTRLWTSRLRDLAGDLLDGRGRLRASLDSSDTCAKSLEVVLRNTWQDQYESVPLLTRDDCIQLLGELLKLPPPDTGDLEKAAVWLRALDLLIGQVAESFFSKPDREAITQLERIKVHLDYKAQRQAKRVLLLHFAFIVLVYSGLVFLIFKKGWDVMEMWTWIIGLGAPLVDYAYFLFTLNEYSLLAFYQKTVEIRKQKLYRAGGFDLGVYEQMTNRVNLNNSSLVEPSRQIDI